VEELAREMPGHFDVVTCMEMLEHVPDPDSIVRACATLAKPGGKVFFSTINRNPKAYLMAVVGAEYILGMLPKGTHDYAKFIKPSELAGSIREAGLVLDHQCGLLYNPLSGQFRLDERDVDVNYMVATHKPG
jgi:2-polyprenyl-6-hydroxyphenyl methylase/3-demethylubiquinone-9 3-methyltransferase